MSLLTQLRASQRTLTGRARMEAEMDEELRSYIEMLVAENVQKGLTPEEARRAAMIKVGSIEYVKDEVRDVRPGMMIENALRDLRYGGRLLRRSPGFACIAILTIALGIGATSAIFSVINSVALKPLPYRGAERLMFITSQFPALGFDKFWISPPEYFELRERSKAYTDIAAYRAFAVNITQGARPERVNAVAMTANMFDVLGVKPRIGRGITPAQDLPNSEPVAVLSDGLWRRMFDSDAGIVGKVVEIQGRKTTVLGVAPPGFDLHDARADVWVPLALDPANKQNRGSHYLSLVGRLKPNVGEAQAQADLRSVVRQWGTLNPGTHVPNDSTHNLQLAPLRDEVIGNVARALWILQGAVVLVLLIACANVANLLLVRAEGRHKEFAIRTALGAGRAAILRQFMAEGLVLTAIGATLGLALAHWGLTALLRSNPASIPRAAEIVIDPRVLLFTTIIAVLTATVFGLAPLLHLSQGAVAAAIKEGGARSTASATRHRVRRALVAGEITLAVVLVTGAGLLLRSFHNLTTVDAGFDVRGLTTFTVNMPAATYPGAVPRVQFVNDLVRRIQEMPGVKAVATMSGMPPYREVNANDTDFEGLPQGAGLPAHNVDYWNYVSDRYFDAMKIPLLKGRGFTPGDANGARAVVINESLAKRFYPNSDPIGRHIRPPSRSDTAPWFTIVGVAKDVKQGGLDQKPGTELYFDIAQATLPNGFVPATLNFAVRSSQPAVALAPTLRSAVRTIDPSLPVIGLKSMESVFGDSVSRQRFLSLLLGIFGGVALLLAAIGTYGVLSYLVTERRREIGIRVALGASAAGIVRLVLRQGLSITIIGIGAGILSALALARVTGSLLFGVSPTDPATYAAVGGMILAVAFIACLVPAGRAMRVDPLVAIRNE